MNLSDKTFLVTGATGGIGKSLCQSLAKNGANLILVARNPRLLKSLAKSLGAAHFVCDLASSTARKRLVSKLHRRAITIDGLINCAGIGIYKPFSQTTEKDWDTSYKLNVTAPYFLSQSLAPFMSSSKLALILNLGSGAGVIPMRGRSLYCSSKFALRGWTLSLAEEQGDKKPHFCLITLGSTLTSFGPMTLKQKIAEKESGKAYFTPEFVADKLVEIIKDDKREVEYTIYPSDYALQR